jgi:glycosyltransferase involved in cell wall biosynthesis
MKVHLACSDANILCQASALREGFSALGHQHVFDITDPDLSFVFVGNSPYESWSRFAETRVRKTIFNVLDLPRHVANWPEIASSWPSQLAKADRVTCISETVQRDLKDLGVRADVIYYPMKAVSHTGVRKYPQFRAMMAGRLCDPGKRAALGIKALIRAGFNESEVAMVGPEYPGWGTNMGVVSDAALNDLYNSVDYLLMTSSFEGLGLPAIEAACCGAIPIVLPDLTTFNEFWAESPLGLHYQLLTSPEAIAGLIKALNADSRWKAEVKQDIMAYAMTKFRPRFDRAKVASRIIDVYHTI